MNNRVLSILVKRLIFCSIYLALRPPLWDAELFSPLTRRCTYPLPSTCDLFKPNRFQWNKAILLKENRRYLPREKVGIYLVWRRHNIRTICIFLFIQAIRIKFKIVILLLFILIHYYFVSIFKKIYHLISN